MRDTRRQMYIYLLRKWHDSDSIPSEGWSRLVLPRIGWARITGRMMWDWRWERVNSASLEQLEVLTEIIGNAIHEHQKKENIYE